MHRRHDQYDHRRHTKLHPRFLVSLAQLAEAIPMPGSGVTLPLNLSQIASRCTGSFYAPRRFAAVQLACELHL